MVVVVVVAAKIHTATATAAASSSSITTKTRGSLGVSTKPSSSLWTVGGAVAAAAVAVVVVSEIGKSTVERSFRCRVGRRGRRGRCDDGGHFRWLLRRGAGRGVFLQRGKSGIGRFGLWRAALWCSPSVGSEIFEIVVAPTVATTTDFGEIAVKFVGTGGGGGGGGGAGGGPGGFSGFFFFVLFFVGRGTPFVVFFLLFLLCLFFLFVGCVVGGGAFCFFQFGSKLQMRRSFVFVVAPHGTLRDGFLSTRPARGFGRGLWGTTHFKLRLFGLASFPARGFGRGLRWTTHFKLRLFVRPSCPISSVVCVLLKFQLRLLPNKKNESKTDKKKQQNRIRRGQDLGQGLGPVLNVSVRHEPRPNTTYFGRPSAPTLVGVGSHGSIGVTFTAIPKFKRWLFGRPSPP